MIQVQGLTKTYGNHPALQGVDLRVGPGERVALIGPNGAGKSTTIKVITAQLRPTEGKVVVDGVNVVEDPEGARRKIGYVPEDPALYDYLTAREFLELVVELRGGGDLGEALDLAGLKSDADRLIREYSQGMRRKTAIAAAVVARPPVLVLDEALNGLDPPSAARVKEHLRTLSEGGTAILISTHALDTVERLADRVVMLSGGKVVADTPTAAIGPEGLEAMFLRMSSVRPSNP